ncbi:MAG: aminopeptidase N [Actinomycetales bacterium]|nr:aminopeptidase N [Actinomycetales bacterium]
MPSDATSAHQQQPRSLARSEAVARAAAIRVSDYEIALDLDRGGTHFGSTVTAHFAVHASPEDLWFDLHATEVHEATLNGIPLDLASWDGRRLPLPAKALIADSANTLTVTATMAYRRDGSGLHRSVDPADGEAYLYQQSFLDAAPSVFGCFDQPDLKARFSLRVRTPHQWVVIGNGAATQQGPGQWELATTPPISTYLVSVCAGPYVAVRAEHDGIPLGLFARASQRAELDRWSEQLFGVTRAGLDAYHELFGIRYPFGDYNQVFVPDFNALAMENPGCVTLRDSFLFRGAATTDDIQRRARTVTHEMAHMWFGDLVTMTWWDDLWLNESFAEYLAHRVLTESPATSQAHAWVDFGIVRKPWGYAAERAPSTHPVSGAPAALAVDALANFDGISYAKGAASIRQLIEFVGDEAFLAGVRNYLQDKAFNNGTCAEFLGAIEAASGRDLTAWADAWLFTADRDTLAVIAGERDSVPQLLVTPPTAYPAARPHVVDVGVYTAGEGQLHQQVCRVVATPGRTPLADLTLPDRDRVVLPNSTDLTWAAVDLDDESLRALPNLLGQITDPLARSVAWQTLRDGVARAVIDPRTYLAAFVASWPRETYPTLVAAVADDIVATMGLFLPPAEVPAAHAAIAAAALGVLHGEDASRHTAAARVVARSSADAALLRSWLVNPPECVAGDRDFRWLVVGRLCAAGRFHYHELAAEEAADPSVSGRLAALLARASVPTEPAKQWAFTELTRRDAGYSNHELVELSRGLWRSPDPWLVLPYVRPWLDALRDMTGWVGEDALGKVMRWGFPQVVHGTTLTAVDVELARPDLPDPLRRGFTEWSWPLREAMASRARFHAPHPEPTHAQSHAPERGQARGQAVDNS